MSLGSARNHTWDLPDRHADSAACDKGRNVCTKLSKQGAPTRRVARKVLLCGLGVVLGPGVARSRALPRIALDRVSRERARHEGVVVHVAGALVDAVLELDSACVACRAPRERAEGLAVSGTRHEDALRAAHDLVVRPKQPLQLVRAQFRHLLDGLRRRAGRSLVGFPRPLRGRCVLRPRGPLSRCLCLRGGRAPLGRRGGVPDGGLLVSRQRVEPLQTPDIHRAVRLPEPPGQHGTRRVEVAPVRPPVVVAVGRPPQPRGPGIDLRPALLALRPAGLRHVRLPPKLRAH
mmetsp:Transcript_20931/g.58781  ORF Transcript_20931/g.58781 Transcript_20931/m.58781 type:complete len:290 (-) Transcript_20931:147-1016(-)